MLLQDSLAAGVRVIDAAIADAALNTIADAIRTQVSGLGLGLRVKGLGFRV